MRRGVGDGDGDGHGGADADADADEGSGEKGGRTYFTSHHLLHTYCITPTALHLLHYTRRGAPQVRFVVPPDYKVNVEEDGMKV